MATVNDRALEEFWAAKAFRYAETYFLLLTKFSDKKKLRLTSIDDAIYEHFRRDFPDCKVAYFDEDVHKSAAGKEKWRKFIEQYTDETVKEFNMATLLRIDAKKGFAEDNVCIVPRIQFFAIEIARNREGENDVHYQAPTPSN